MTPGKYFYWFTIRGWLSPSPLFRQGGFILKSTLNWCLKANILFKERRQSQNSCSSVFLPTRQITASSCNGGLTVIQLLIKYYAQICLYIVVQCKTPLYLQLAWMFHQSCIVSFLHMLSVNIQLVPSTEQEMTGTSNTICPEAISRSKTQKATKVKRSSNRSSRRKPWWMDPRGLRMWV